MSLGDINNNGSTISSTNVLILVWSDVSSINAFEILLGKVYNRTMVNVKQL